MVDRTYVSPMSPTKYTADDGIIPFPPSYSEQFTPRRNLSKAVVAIHHQLALAEREEAMIELGDTNKTVNRLIDVITHQGTTISKLVKRVRNVNKTLNVEIYTLKGELDRARERELKMNIEIRRLTSIEEEYNELKKRQQRVYEKRSQGQIAKYKNMRSKE
jgi:hypothetical protein